MTQLLQKAIKVLYQLTESEQDAIAAQIIQMLGNRESYKGPNSQETESTIAHIHTPYLADRTQATAFKKEVLELDSDDG